MSARDNWPLPVAWPKLLDEIALLLGEPDPIREGQRVSIGVRTLATALDVPRGTLQGWLDGSIPRHDDGEILIERWCRLTGKTRIFLPRERRPLNATER